MLPLQGTWVHSLVKELRSRMPGNTAKKLFKFFFNEINKNKAKKKVRLPIEIHTSVHMTGKLLHAKSLQSCLTLVTPWTVACQAPLSMGFSRQEYWSELPFPTLGDLPDPRDQTYISYVSCIGWWVLYH